MLGSALLRAWRQRHRVVATSLNREACGVVDMIGDLTASGFADALMDQARPDFVVHAAAWTDVDGCEADPVRAMEVNAAATGRLAASAQGYGAAFVYISTEAVFDGSHRAYAEDDLPNPVNRYAASKLAGEQETISAHPAALILRISLEGWRQNGKPGFVQWIVEGLRRGERRRVCTDWIHTIIFASNVAEVIERLWAAGAAGLYHAGMDTPASNLEIAQATAEEFGLDSSLLVPIQSDTLGLRAPRPKNTSLISARLRQTIGAVVWDLPTGLAQMRLEERELGMTPQRVRE
jgi:dTDP-4-dehydrorhamnose reductase